MADAPNQRQMSKIQQKQLKLRDQLFPGVDQSRLWLRQKSTGFTTVPRGLPLLLRIMDELAEKGKPVSSTYLDLWCRTWGDTCFVTLNHQAEMALAAGFTGQRAVHTWRTRMRILAELGFIAVRPGPWGEFSYALIWNPYSVAKGQLAKGASGLTEMLYNTLEARVIEIGAEDLEDNAA